MAVCTIVVDDHASGLRSARVSHGFSCFISAGSSSLLFDTGSDGTLLYNAPLMNLPLEDISAVVLSHGHYDHAGGLRQLVSSVPCPLLVTGVGCLEPKYRKHGDVMTYIGCGFDGEFLSSHAIEHREVPLRLELAPHLWVLGSFPRRYAFETIDPRFVKSDGRGDAFDDEVALVVENEDSLSLLCACSHPGILSMVSHAESVFGKKVRTVAGGVHLASAAEERIERTMETLSLLGVERLHLCHCSGEAAIEAASSCGLFTSEPLGVGDMLRL